MRRPMIGLAVAFGFSLLAPASQAQGFGNFNDPFTFYYGFYLPHQAAIAAQPTPMDTINAVTAARQYNAPTNRTGMFDPVSPYGLDDPDIFGAGGPRSGAGAGRVHPRDELECSRDGPRALLQSDGPILPGPAGRARPQSQHLGGQPTTWDELAAFDAQHARRFLSETEDRPGIRPAETSSRSGGFHPRGEADLFCER